MRSKSDIGGWWQDKFWELISGFKHCGPIFKHRFKDARSASSVGVGQAPGDFLIGQDSAAYLIELKASKKHESLRSVFSDTVENHQIASLRMWALSGNPGMLLFYSDLIGMVEFWPVSELVRARKHGVPLNKDKAHTFVLEGDFYSAFMDCRLRAIEDLESGETKWQIPEEGS